MMFTNAHYFPGLTLVADDGPAQRMDEMAQRLLEKMPSVRLRASASWAAS